MDPFSVITGSAGLISLGLTVSGGLIQYCKDYQSRDADLAQLSQHAQELKTFLTLVETRNKGPQAPHQDIYTPLKECQDACEACLQDIKRLNDKCTRRSRKIIQNLAYPFDKGKLQDQRTQLREFNMRLLGYLQLVNLDLTRSIRTQMSSESAQVTTAITAAERQIRTSISNAERTISSTTREGINQLEASFQQGIQKAETNVTASVTADLRLISDDFGKGREQQTSIIMHRLDQVIQILQRQDVSMANNRMRPDITSLSNTQQHRNVVDWPSSAMSTGTIPCDCSRTRHKYSTTQHRKGCPYSFSNRKKRSYTWKLGAFGRQIISKFNIEYSQLEWARDCKVYPNLTLRATVSFREAPAFQTIVRLVDSIEYADNATVQDIDAIFQRYLLQLRQIFITKRGWVTDVDQWGRNLFHIALNILRSPIMRDVEAAVLFVQFITALVRMGVPINDIGRSRKTPLQYGLFLLRLNPNQMAARHVFSKLLELDAAIHHIRSSSDIAAILSLNIIDLYEIHEPLICTELLHQVLLRSESGIIRSLRSNASSLYDRTTYGQTPLHLAANWPRGLSILIEYGSEAIQSITNIEDQFSWTALQNASYLRNPNSIRLLLSAGASIKDDIFCNMLYPLSTAEEAFVGVVIKFLVLQRKELLTLALQNLSSAIIEKLGLKEGIILDHEAADVAGTLMQQKVHLPAIFNTLRPGSVYHWSGMNAFIAQKLFDAGFHRTNTHFHGHTSLMVPSEWRSLTSVLDLVSWFLEHGADLYAPTPIPCRYVSPDRGGLPLVYPAIHRLMCGVSTFHPNSMDPSPSSKQLSQFSKLLQDKSTDPCQCYCTINGCTSASKYSLHFANYCARWGLIKGELKQISKTLELVERAVSDCIQSAVVVLSLIRTMSFQKLGMKHTCCRYEHWWKADDVTEHELLCLMDPTEVDEIREEDRYLAKMLETLMLEFEAKYREMKVPLSRFVKEYWWPRMNEVDKERDVLLAEELNAIKEIGVILNES